MRRNNDDSKCPKNIPYWDIDEPIRDLCVALQKINERLINEYISKVGCCDECFASVYCTVNGLRESRVPQDYCVENIKRYFSDNARQWKGDKEE